jgi:hypothetical protein
MKEDTVTNNEAERERERHTHTKTHKKEMVNNEGHKNRR